MWPVLLKGVAIVALILLTIGGNLIVIISIARSSVLRAPTRYLIVSLAIADLLLGCTVIPVSGLRELFGTLRIYHAWICTVWTFLDVLCCTASILSLCGISIDRYIGVSRPLLYSGIVTKKRTRIFVSIIWMLAFSISSCQILFLGNMPSVSDFDVNIHNMTLNDCQVNKNLGYVIFSAIGSFYLPATVIIVLYYAVYRAAIRHRNLLNSGGRITRNDVMLRVHTSTSVPCKVNDGAGTHKKLFGKPGVHNHVPIPQLTLIASNNDGTTRCSMHMDGSKFKRQKKAAKTLGIVVGCFLLCWFPFFIILIIDAACESCHLEIFFDIFFWLGYFNSCINPFIYAFTSRDLRKAFLALLPSKMVPDKRKFSQSVSQPSPNTHSPNTTMNLVNYFQESKLSPR